MTPVSAMVSIKFSRGKFSRPATGYECIAHAPAFDRGVLSDLAYQVLPGSQIVRENSPSLNLADDLTISEPGTG